MSYKVICYFEDLQDFNHPYNVGDIFPRQGMKVSESRLAELSSTKNRRGIALIVADEEEKASVVETEKVEKNVAITKTEINRMSVANLRELAKENGIADAEEISGSVLKKMLIDKLA